MAKSYYDILGVEKDASQDEIKIAYKERVKESHPDHGGSSEDFIKITEAYETLKDEDKRKEYDEHGEMKGTRTISDVAISVVQTYFKKFLGSGDGILKIDVLVEIRKLLSIDEKRNIVKRKRVKNQLKLFEKIQGKIERKGNLTFSPIEDLLSDEVESCKDGLKQTNYQSLVHEVIIQILDDYTYAFDGKEMGDA